MGKSEDKVKTKKINQGTIMGIAIAAVILLLVAFILLGGVLGKWIDNAKAKRASDAEASSSANSSAILSDSSTVDSGNSDSSEPTVNDGYPKDEVQLTTDYQLGAPDSGDTIAVITTSLGTMKFKLFPENAPLAVNNFVTKAKDGYYNNTLFKQIITDEIVQSDGDANTIHGEGFSDEFSVNLHNFTGALGASNTGEDDSNTNQFYIVTAKTVTDDIISAMSGEAAQSMGLGFTEEVIAKYDEFGGYPILDGEFPVFGQLYEGFDVLTAINNIAPVEAGTDQTPSTDIKILSVEIATY